MWKNSMHKKKKIETVRICIVVFIATVFAILFLLPILLTITNSFMAESEIASNYGDVFAVNDKGGKVYISETVNLKFIPDMVSFMKRVRPPWRVACSLK